MSTSRNVPNKKNNTKQQKYQQKSQKQFKTVRATGNGEKEPFSLAMSYGHIPVVTASVHLLSSFLLRHLSFISSKEEKVFGSLTVFAAEAADKVSEHRQCLQRLINETMDSNMTSYSADVFNIQENQVKKGNGPTHYSVWYRSGNFAPNSILESNPVTLVDADAFDLIKQLTYRLGKAIFRLHNNGNSSFDIYVKDNLSNFKIYLNNLADHLEKDDIYDNFLDMVESQAKIKKDYYLNNRNLLVDNKSSNRTHHKSVDKSTVKSTDKQVEKTVEESSEKVPEVPKRIVIPKSACKPVVGSVSFAQAAGKPQTASSDTNDTKVDQVTTSTSESSVEVKSLEVKETKEPDEEVFEDLNN
ncbi:hypothetical protein QJ850_gp347 [Acanthamoeba polyphaga mimivirus]|uniref:Uncharacterized protein n=1 Tax=Acanthamoeba polyphaga mimivirus Kroon TaxID=3069720 RepID=A0A0G2Y932_9VIRU|nr:hypothetical protein QJ850_gp347 [Acanthamoeba polyphaga mimivirus]AKI80352.1 hypothetical protein [Acanthamoeba polyphaga mimivirus Kroon]